MAGPDNAARRALLAGLGAAALGTGLPAAARRSPDTPIAPLKGALMEKPVLVFDVTETLLDLRGLAPVFRSLFGSDTMLRAWFDGLLLYSEALTLAGAYADAGKVGAAVLRMLADADGRTVGAGDLAAFAQAAATLPAYADVRPGLQRLREAGFRMVALSNSPGASCEAQLQHAGLRPFFERVFSIDDGVRRYKPAPEAYAAVALALDARPADLLMVTCHAFDALGALSAGLRAALILRPGNAPFNIGKQPELISLDLDALSAVLAGR